MNRSILILSSFLTAFCISACQKEEMRISSYGCEAVDMGTSVKWAQWNLGARSSEEPGYFFAWGDTKKVNGNLYGYDWTIYKWSPKTSDFDPYTDLTRYNTEDGFTRLLPEDDAATANWGSGWRTPTSEEFFELFDESVFLWKWTDSYNGSKTAGYTVTSSITGNSIFFPANGFYSQSVVEEDGEYGYYWSCSMDCSEFIIHNSGIHSAVRLKIWADNAELRLENRWYGMAIRPVMDY